MVTPLANLIGYICKHDPRKNDLTEWRLNWLVYLSDWKHVLLTGCQITDISWENYSRGPYSERVLEEVERYPNLFTLREIEWYDPMRTFFQRLIAAFGLDQIRNDKQRDLVGKTTVTIVQLANPLFEPYLTLHEQQAVDHVLRVAGRLPDDEFERLVLSTYPAITQPKYQPLDLPALAKKYREEFPVDG